MFIVLLSLLDYFNFGKVSHEHKYYSGKNGVVFRFYRAFLLFRPSKVAKSANCNFILVNCFVETKNTSTAFYVIIK